MRIVRINGCYVRLCENKPIKVLSDEEVQNTLLKQTAKYKAKHTSNNELLDEYLNSLRFGHVDHAAIYKNEILSRMQS